MSAAHIWKAPTQPFTARLDESFLSSDASISVTNVTGLQAPGIVVVERLDSNSASSSKIEYCSYTGITGNSLTGLTRGLGGTTAVNHGSGALVECYFSIDYWNDWISTLTAEHVSATDATTNWNKHLQNITITGVSGASGIRGDWIIIPKGNMVIEAKSGASGYSSLSIDKSSPGGINIPPFSIEGGLASGMIGATPLNIIEDNYTLKYVAAAVRYPASGASLVLDINKNGTSIFDAANRICITGGGTFASTASIATKVLSSGNLLSLDIDMCNQAGDLTVVLGV